MSGKKNVPDGNNKVIKWWSKAKSIAEDDDFVCLNDVQFIDYINWQLPQEDRIPAVTLQKYKAKSVLDNPDFLQWAKDFCEWWQINRIKQQKALYKDMKANGNTLWQRDKTILGLRFKENFAEVQKMDLNHSGEMKNNVSIKFVTKKNQADE